MHKLLNKSMPKHAKHMNESIKHLKEASRM